MRNGVAHVLGGSRQDQLIALRTFGPNSFGANGRVSNPEMSPRMPRRFCVSLDR